jgi:hypothetical protein
MPLARVTEAGDDLRVWVLFEHLGERGLEAGDVGYRGVERVQQRGGVCGHRGLYPRRLTQLVLVQGGVDLCRCGGDAAGAAGAAQRRGQAGTADQLSLRWGRCQVQDGAGFPTGQLGEGGQEGRVVLAQHGAQLVGDLHPVPDRVLMRPGQYVNRLRQLRVHRQRPVSVWIGAQDVGQHERIPSVTLGPARRMPIPVTGDRQRVDRDQRDAGGA